MFSLTYFESKKASKALPNPIITSIRESSFVVFSKWLRLGFHLVLGCILFVAVSLKVATTSFLGVFVK